MHSILMCIRHEHDPRLILLSVLVCTIGVYAAFPVSKHAVRLQGAARRLWAGVCIVASGCTAWATHFIVLLAFKPPTPAAFDPVLTAASLLSAIVVIGAGVAIAVSTRNNAKRFSAGMVVGSGIAALHYLGQAAYLVRGVVHWDFALVIPSVVAGILTGGVAILAAGARSRGRRRCAPLLLLLSIAILHFSGMAAMTITPDRRLLLPAGAMSPAAITPVVAGICLGLLALAIVGLRFDLAAKAALRRDRERLGELANVALEGLLICDGDAVITCNQSAERLIGRKRGALAGSSASLLFPSLDLLSLPEREEREAELVREDGQAVPVRVLRSQVPVGHKMQTVIAVRDQRERLRTEAQIRTLASHDPLTGLPNRTHFYDLLAMHAASRRQGDRGFAVLMIDLDRFKPVNDTFGHAAGDVVLRKVADRLSASLREGDVVARLGGDEFAVLQLDVHEPDAPALLAQRLADAIGRLPFMLEGGGVVIGASVGVARAPVDGDDPATLLRNAGLALYAAKTEGSGTFRLFDAGLDERMQERRTLEAGLRRALVNDELELHYQPLVEARTGRITSAEALVRWRDPERGLVPPSEFIELAEETGLIVPLGEWVLRTACAEAATWPDDLSVAVNLSPVQFREAKLADTITAALRDAGLPPERLEVEITEGVLLADEKQTLAILKQLRGAGIRLSMDDFGTGYSSLSYLRRFPFNKIKVDQSFIRQLPADGESAAIVRAIITMGACLGMSTTVEGVETPEQFSFSADEGCDHLQGFLISEPLPAQAFKAFLAESGSVFSFPGRDGEPAAFALPAPQASMLTAAA